MHLVWKVLLSSDCTLLIAKSLPHQGQTAKYGSCLLCQATAPESIVSMSPFDQIVLPVEHLEGLERFFGRREGIGRCKRIFIALRVEFVASRGALMGFLGEGGRASFSSIFQKSHFF